MDRDSLLELLSKEDVIALLEELGSDWYKEEINIRVHMPWFNFTQIILLPRE